MALNPFFLQGSPSEQRLIQELINEELTIYGIEVTYIPRKFVRRETIMSEISSSRFDDNFLLEAYVNTYDGYGGAGDILTKFGMSLKDELTITISKERFEDFIAPFLSTDDSVELTTRPKEGDLVYFPLGQRLFEVKFVEHEQPFYQLGRNYVYELKCELFEYEDEVIDTSIDEVDNLLQDKGPLYTLNLFLSGSEASASAFLTPSTGYIRRIYVDNQGSRYTSTPTVAISSAPSGGLTATAVAITTSIAGLHGVKEILIVNPGYGYTETPTITITGGGGVGASATCAISTTGFGIGSFLISNGGFGFSSNPNIIAKPTLTTPNIQPILRTVVGSSTTISKILIVDAGNGYNSAPDLTIDPPPVIIGIGTYQFNEIVTGSTSQTQARVKSWDADTKILKISNVGISTLSKSGFLSGESIVGSASSAIYSLKSFVFDDTNDKYTQNDEIEQSADLILDFSESNPFGNY